MREKIYPTFDEFKDMAKEANVLPVYTVKTADLLTPLAILCKLPHGNHTFLLESIEGDENWSRYSLMGIAPKLIFKIKDKNVTIIEDGREENLVLDDPIARFKELFNSLRVATPKNLSGMPAGFVGYFSYDSFRLFDPSFQHRELEPFDAPDVYLMFTDDLLLVDRFSKLLYVIHNVRLSPGETLEQAYDKAVERVQTISKYIDGPLHEEYLWAIAAAAEGDPSCNINREEFVSIAAKAFDAIRNADAKRVVLAQRWVSRLQATAINMYRSMRYVTPEPYGYYMKMGSLEIIGTSPEAIARTSDGEVMLRAVAGERPRPGNATEDEAIQKKLERDSLIIDELRSYLAQSEEDMQRIAEPDSIRTLPFRVARTMSMFRYEGGFYGRLKPDTSLIDVVGATLPYPAVSGVPRRQALQLIESLEQDRRGLFGGAVGYLGLNGKMDLVAADKTVLIHRGRTHVQIGVPITERTNVEESYEWGAKRASDLFEALGRAAAGLELSDS